MPEQITSLDNQPSAPLAEPTRATGVDSSEQQSDLVAARSQLVRQFIQLLSQSQGQLPQAQEQKLQPLLRQMIPLLSTEDGKSSALLPNEPPTESRTLSQLIQKVIQQLPTSDPLLKNLQQAAQSKAATSAPPMPTASFPLLEQALNALSSLPNANSMDSKTLGLWILQLLALRAPALAREQTASQPELKSALLQQGITLPEQALLADRQSQSKLLQLGKASIQFMHTLLLASQTGNLQPSGRQEKSIETSTAVPITAPPDAGTEPLQQTGQEQDTSNKRAALLERVGERIQQFKASILGATTESKSTAGQASSEVVEQSSTISDETTLTTAPSAKEAKQTEKSTLPLNHSPELGKNSLKGAISPITNERGSKSLLQSLSLNEFVQVLQQESGRIPTPLRPLMQSLTMTLQQPLTTDAAVREWIAFVKAPLDDNSPQGRNLRQWGTTLLAIRFGLQGQLSAEQHKQLNQLLASTNALQLNPEEQSAVGKLTGHFLGQVEKIQQQASEPGQPLPGYIPLPSPHTERRESGISQQANKKADGGYEWSLNFSLDLGQMGALQIRVKLDLPDLQMQLTAEKMSTVDRIKETLPLLEQRFRELGLQPVTLGCRQGKVCMLTETQSSPTSEGGLSIHI